MPLLEQGGLVRPSPTLIWMGLAPVLKGPLLMMASFAGARVVSVLLGSVPCEESKMRPVGACKVHVILFVNITLVVELCELLIPS